MADLCRYVKTKRRQPVQEFAEAFPLPVDYTLEDIERDTLYAAEELLGVFPVSFCSRRDAEPTVPCQDGGDAVPARRCAKRVPQELGVVVGVHIDETGRNGEAASIDDTPRIGADIAGLHDSAVVDRNVSAVCRLAGAVDDTSILD